MGKRADKQRNIFVEPWIRMGSGLLGMGQSYVMNVLATLEPRRRQRIPIDVDIELALQDRGAAQSRTASRTTRAGGPPFVVVVGDTAIRYPDTRVPHRGAAGR